MATMQGITGKLSGKMGSAVFRVREGQQVVTQYNPIVKNPNTEGQQTQRAKFKLMSQLAAIMAPGFGTMSVTTRKAKGKPSQRNAFTQLNFPLVEVTSDNEEVTAKIPMEQLKLTSSMRIYGTLGLDSTTSSVQVQIENLDTAIKDGRIILVGYGTMTPTKAQARLIEVVDVPVVDGMIDYEFTGLEPGKYTVLSFGMIPTGSTAIRTSLDNIHTPADEDFISAVTLDAMVREGLMMETATIGGNITIQNA